MSDIVLHPVRDQDSGRVHLAELVDGRRRRDRRRHPSPAGKPTVICREVVGPLQPVPEPRRRLGRRKLQWCQLCKAYATAAGLELS